MGSDRQKRALVPQSPFRAHARPEFAALDLLQQSAAGIAISGTSGSGKSQLMRRLLLAVSAAGQAVFLLDPAGDLVGDLEVDFLSMPRRVRERLRVIRPFRVDQGVASINVLRVPVPRSDPTYGAKLATKVKFAAAVLLNAWGETDFNSKPLLYKWTHRVLTILARAGLPMAAARHLFATGSEVYQALSALAPDFLARMEMEELAEMKPREREEQIASTKNRFLGLFTNPTVELLMSVTDRAIDVQRMIQEDAIVLVDLSTGEGDLDRTDADILANLWLMEIAFAAFNTRREMRRQATVFIDELPLFRGSFPLLEHTMPLVRKLLLRWVVAFQGAYVFPDGPEDRLLNLALGNCGCQFVFGHGSFRDCEFLAKQTGISSYSPFYRKHTDYTPVQLNAGHEIQVLVDESENWSQAEQEGGGEADGVTSTTTNTKQTGTGGQTSQRITDALSGAVTVANSHREGNSQADAEGSVHSVNKSWSKTNTRGGGRTYKQTLVPKFEVKWIENITWLNSDEFFLDVAAKIAGFPVGRCIVYRRGIETKVIQLPLLQTRFEATPKLAAKKLLEFRHDQRELPFVWNKDELLRNLKEFTERLVRALRDGTHGSQLQGPRDDKEEQDGDCPELGI